MAAKILNIEVGDRLTKVCMSVPKGKSYEIKNCFMFQTPENAVSDGQVLLPDVLGGLLRQEIDAHHLGDVKKAIFTLSSSKVASREVTIPPVRDSRIKGVIEANAEDYFPVDISKYHIAYSLLERQEKGENPGCRVLVYAALKTLIDSYFQLAEVTKLTVQAIDYAGNSQYQAIRTLGNEGVTMFANIDCSNTVVSFLKDNELIMQRSFTFGGDDLVLNYMGAAQLSQNDYVNALLTCNDPEHKFIDDGVMSAEDVNENLQRLVNSIARSNDYYNQNHWEDPVSKVILMGPCSNLYGLCDMVAEGSALPTSLLTGLPGAENRENPADSASAYIACVGSNIAPLDLIPEEYAEGKKKKKKAEGTKEGDNTSILGGILICVVCLAATAALCFMAITNYQDALEQKNAVEREIAEKSYTREVYNSYTDYQNSANTLVMLDESLKSPNDNLKAFIEELEKKMPSGILFLSVSCSQDYITMNVTTPDYTSAAAAIAQLRNFETIQNVVINNLTEAVDETEGTYVKFAVQGTYGENPYLNNVYPYGSADVNK